MTAPIECKGLSKHYGELAAVAGLSFTVEPGSVTGFVGHNGAGKTTTLRMLLGLARPSAGDAYLLGKPCLNEDRSHLAAVGYLPESPAFYRWMNPREFLLFVGEIMGMDERERRGKSAEMLEVFGLSRLAGRKLSGLSKGERQRLGLAQAMMADPALLILDEPTSGLDPLGRHELLTLISQAAGKRTIFLSSHILEDVEKVCDRVVMISRGKLVESGKLREVVERNTEPGLIIEVRDGADELARALEGEDWAGKVSLGEGLIRLAGPDFEKAQYKLPGLISLLGLPLLNLQSSGGDLTEVYLKLSGGGDG
jgi:ABC-2 type transport system ATP-binding protein